MQTSLLFAAMPVSIAAVMYAAQRAAAGLGRLQTILLFKLVAVVLLLLMAAAPRLWHVTAAIVPIFLARTTAANSTSALGRSVLMDYVPKVRCRSALRAAALRTRCSMWRAALRYGPCP